MPAVFNFPRTTPEAQGIASEAIVDFVATAENTIHSLHSFMLLRHGSVVAEGWWHPWRPETPHMLFSLSKSFTSTAVGLAITEGYLSVDDPVISFFRDETPEKMSSNLAAMKVRHLLSMSTGHHLDTTEEVFRSRNPIKAFLGLPVEHTPGTYFVYNTAASYMLSAIVQRRTGLTLHEYLTPRLFEPLGITGAAWETHPNGVNFGGWGLNITTEDIARFGQLYLQKGLWIDKQILPGPWVETVTSKQISTGNEPNIDWTQGYGYQFWRGRHNTYRGDGAFGQFCIVIPEQEAVLVMTAGVPEMQIVLNVVWEKLLPAMQGDRLPEDKASAQTLSRRLKSLGIDPPQGATSSSMAGKVSGKTYLFEANYEALQSLHIDFCSDCCTITYRLSGGGERAGTHSLITGYGTWRDGMAILGAPTPQRVAASGVWIAEDTFRLTLCQYETPFILMISCRFEDNKIFYDLNPNVCFGSPQFPQLVGIAGEKNLSNGFKALDEGMNAPEDGTSDKMGYRNPAVL